MVFVCQKCSYVMSHEESYGYMSAECYKFFQNVILPVLIVVCAKKSFKSVFQTIKDGIILAFLNNNKIKCPVCHKYVEWLLKSVDFYKNQDTNESTMLK